jgi:hypothetical protein
MSTNTMPMGNNEPVTPSRFMHHFDLHGIWGCLVFMVAATILGSLGMTDGFDTLFWVMVAIQVLYLIVAFTASKRHRVLLCPHCVDEFPLNPDEAAAGRARFALRYFHAVFDGSNTLMMFLERWVRSKILALIVVCALAWGVAWCLSFVLRGWYGVILVAAFVLLVHAKQRHQQLQIWCPKCRHDDGDDDDDHPEPEPEPDPAVETDLSKVA